MRFIFYSPVALEAWDYRSPMERGIGGSETSHIEMAWRLARRGHQVISYSRLPADCPDRSWRGVEWRDLDTVDFTEDAVWIDYRSPEALDRLEVTRDRRIWFVSQDEWYSTMTEERAAKLDIFWALCAAHAASCISRSPGLKSKARITSNGIRTDLLRELRTTLNVERNPLRLMFASSPDRGLVNLLKIFKRAREFVPELELHCFYGFDNIDKLIALGPEFAHYARRKADIERAMDQPNVTWHGRVGQLRLLEEWHKTGIWAYPTNFTETSCITAMEAQACGAIPIVRPLWALASNVRHGVLVDGDMDTPLSHARVTAQIVKLALDPELQEQIRAEAIEEIPVLFNWERFVDQWEESALGLRAGGTQFTFQHKHATGRVLNVGSDRDISGFGKRGAVNLDVRPTNPINNEPNVYDVLHDIRQPLHPSLGLFDTIVLGDILEHLPEADWERVFINCGAALNPGGRLVITCPNDGQRDQRAQWGAGVGDGRQEYAAGCSAFHSRSISRETLERQLEACGFSAADYQVIDYSHFDGHGIVAEVSCRLAAALQEA